MRHASANDTTGSDGAQDASSPAPGRPDNRRHRSRRPGDGVCRPIEGRGVEWPAVALLPQGAADPGSPTVRGSFDGLVDGVARGHLHRPPDEISGKPTWGTGDAAGPLAALADQRWNDCSANYAYGRERWLAGVLAAIIRSTLRGR
jgi:hypothetical protein